MRLHFMLRSFMFKILGLYHIQLTQDYEVWFGEKFEVLTIRSQNHVEKRDGKKRIDIDSSEEFDSSSAC